MQPVLSVFHGLYCPSVLNWTNSMSQLLVMRSRAISYHETRVAVGSLRNHMLCNRQSPRLSSNFSYNLDLTANFLTWIRFPGRHDYSSNQQMPFGNPAKSPDSVSKHRSCAQASEPHESLYEGGGKCRGQTNGSVSICAALNRTATNNPHRHW